MGDGKLGFEALNTALKAAGEETRLRVLALLSEAELTVSDLTDILRQSQPRISRHLKLLVEAGLVERFREGTWAFFRLAEHGAGGDSEEKRRQAVTLLFHAFCSDGPSTSHTIDFDKARERLGDALPYVMSVERALRTDLKIYPVFTDSTVRLPG